MITLKNVNSFLSHPRNRTTILIVSIVASTVCVADCAEFYLEARTRRIHAQQLESEITTIEHRIHGLEPTAEALRQSTAQLKSRLVSVSEFLQFREHVVTAVRDAGCQLRSLSFDDRESRRWMKDDSPDSDRHLEMTGDEVASDYLLETQRMSLSTAGRFHEIQSLLNAIQNCGKFIRTDELLIQTDATEKELSVVWGFSVIDFVYDEVSDASEFDDE